MQRYKQQGIDEFKASPRPVRADPEPLSAAEAEKLPKTEAGDLKIGDCVYVEHDGGKWYPGKLCSQATEGQVFSLFLSSFSSLFLSRIERCFWSLLGI